MEILTKEQFDLLSDGQVFATGVLPNAPEGLFMTNEHQGEDLRWIAKKGWGYDWAIYCHWAEHSAEWIAERGDKVTSETHIKRCVPCDEDVFKKYRY